MSFTPLPKIFTDYCADLDFPSSQIMELGCGDGRFRAMMSVMGASCWGLDRIPPGCGTVADIVGDAAEPPLREHSLDLLVVPNLLRHMLPTAEDYSFVGRWLDLLKPGASLFIFEDEPGADSPGEANYRDLQILLSQLMPESRGPLLSLEGFKKSCSDFHGGAAWGFGLERNRQSIAAGPVLEMLGQGGKPTGEVGRLTADINAYGLDPGRYWWARAETVREGKGH